ncbi:MAG: hypothetical protein J6I64_07390 [Lachnospiraceae bacterium]|nr:hypothetical protein [Lachnospiraceae bacterium]
MAAFGARYMKFAPFAGEEPAAALPAYGESVQLGGLNKADLTVNLASGEIHGDDVLDERVEEFVSGTLAVEVTDLAPQTESVVYGSKMGEDGELVDKTSDETPYGGLGYIKTLIRKGKKIYRAIYLPKVKAALGNDNAATKSNSITLATHPLAFTVFEPNNGEWRYRKEFTGDDGEAQAKAYIDEKLGVTEAAQANVEDDGQTTE